MNTFAAQRRRSHCANSYFRTGIFLVAFFCGLSLHAQLTTLTQTYAVPHFVDGSALSVFFDFSAQLSNPTASLSHTTLSLDFAKQPDLSDDPPFYSEMGFVLRKLDTHFAVLSEVTLVELGSFNDGDPFTLFDGTITFDDAATEVVNSNPDQPSSGLFRGEQPLSLLDGAFSPYWELRVVDDAFQNPLLFHSATLTVDASVAAGTPVPESSAFALSGAGLLLAMVGLRRRFSPRASLLHRT